MYSRFIKIIGGILVVGIVILSGYFMFFRNKNVLGNSDPFEGFSQTGNSEQYVAENKNENTDSFKTIGFQHLFQPITRPLEPAISYIVGVFSGSEADEQALELGNDGTQQKLFTPRPPLTDREIFDRLWPPGYREALQSIEILMIEDGFVAEREQRSVVRSDADIYAILSKLIDYAEKQSWIVAEDAEKLRVGVTVDLPQQIEAERKALQMNGMGTSTILPRNQRIAESDKQSLIVGIIDGLKYMLSAHYADAQIPSVPGWHTTPDCYKDLMPFNPVPGFNSLAICCNCGLFCIPPLACVFIPDCGPFSVACTIPLGCLNLNCALWPNAIWDRLTNPFSTGTCGCG